MTHIKKSDTAKTVTFETYFQTRYGIILDRSKREVLIKDPTREDRKPSIAINIQKQTFYDHANGIGGSIIDWCIYKENKTFCGSINELTSGSFSFCCPIYSCDQPTEPTRIITEVVPIWSYALKNYLEQERCIPSEVYNKYLKEIRYTDKGKEYYAIGFQSDSGGWELRTKNFKGCIGTKDITHIKNDSNVLYVYEGWADFLSYVAEYQGVEDLTDYLILNSTSHVKKALSILDAYESVECYTDGDTAGYAAGEALMTHWVAIGKEREDFGFHSPRFNGTDVNGVWVGKCKNNTKTA